MSDRRRRRLRGAAAGALAAGVWALQQPLDMRVFGVRYDDTELLGKAVTRGSNWRPIGAAVHLANGAAFGAAYASAVARSPLPEWANGPLAATIENFGLWPLVGLTDRFHPAHEQLPDLAGNRAALAQATWRHLLFGTVLGETERRLRHRYPDAGTPE